jgi:hypothetical protein
MAIYDLWLSRNNGPTASNYVGHEGRLFYDPAERVLRISDGATAGGEVFNGIVTVANTAPTANFQGQIWLDPQTFELSVYHNGNFIPTIDTATETKIGGVKLGPGVTTNAEGQIIIDSTGLDFSFGDLASTTGTHNDSTAYAILSTINTNEDMVLASNGTGAIKIVGQFDVYKTNGVLSTIMENEEPVFQVRADGQMRMLVPEADSNEGALNIIGGLNGVFQNPLNTGVMLHITGIAGTPGVPSRVYNDAQNAFAAFVARRYNGTAAAPTAVLADEEIMRLSGTAHNGTLIPGTGNQRIVYVARGNQTTSNQGGAIELWATPINTITLAKIATVDSTGITLESGKVLTGNVTGNADTVTNGVYTNGSYANPSWITSLVGSKVTNAVLTTDTGTVTNTMLAGSIANAKLSNSSITVNGTAIALGASGTVTAAAGTLTGTTLNATVVTSSLTTVGTLTSLTVTNAISGGSVSDSIGNVRSIPINGQTGAYNLAATDNGKMISITTGGVSVLQNVFADPYGQIISIYNNSNTSQTITQGAGVTLRLAGTAATGNRTLARYGVATITCVAANTFVISGAGIT